MPRESNPEVVIGVQARLYGPAAAALDAARAVAEGVGGFVTRTNRLGAQLLAVEIELLAPGVASLPGALDAARLRHDVRAADLPDGLAPDTDVRCRLAIQIVNDEPDGSWQVPPVPG